MKQGDYIWYIIARVVERNLDIITSPSPVSNPYFCIGAHRAEYDEIVALGNDAFQYMFSVFDMGNQQGLRGFIMASACCEIMGLDPEFSNAEIDTGQKWYDAYKQTRLTAFDAGVLSKIYLGMTNGEVYAMFGEPDFQASGLTWYGYTDVGVFDPCFSATGAIERISLDNGKEWDMHELISAAVMRHNDGQYYAPDGAHPTEAHAILALDADINGFTAYVMSLWQTFLPKGEYDVREVGGAHVPLALTFEKNQNGDYELAEYWEPGDGAGYIPSIRSKFPEGAWGKVDTQLYIEAHKKSCYDQAMYFFVGVVPYDDRIGIRLNTGDAANITKCAGIEVIEGTHCFLVKYLPGASLLIEPYGEDRNGFGDGPDLDPGKWTIRYADSSKNIQVGGAGSPEITITDDLIGIYDIGTYDDGGLCIMKFEKYTKTG